MFKENKYCKWYYGIIDKRRLNKPDGYVESHHIIPLSLGGADTADNRVKLTAREHFICHMLLLKMVEGASLRSMSFAIHCMLNWNGKRHKRYSPNASNLYESIRKTIRSNMKLSKESRDKKILSMKGRKHSAETKAAMSKSQKGKPKSESAREAIRKSAQGRKLSEKRRAAISERQKGKLLSEVTKSKKKFKCLKSIYLLKSPDGTLFEIDDLYAFCKIYKLSHSSVRRSNITQIPIGLHRNKPTENTGWICLSIESKKNRNTEFQFCKFERASTNEISEHYRKKI